MTNITYSELFERVLDCPSNYVSHDSISLIKPFLDGYVAATNCDNKDAFYFTDWVADRFNRKTAHNWESIISFIGVSEAKAYELTKQLWEECKNQTEFVSDRHAIPAGQGTLMHLKTSELLEKMLDRPALFIGRASVPRMKAFIDGYEFGKHGEDATGRDSLYAGFQAWIATRFHIETAHDWASIIAFMGLSESGAFTLLKELWDEYKAKMKESLSTFT
jgi:hypothetical protein